jgi:hypothetical protein
MGKNKIAPADPVAGVALTIDTQAEKAREAVDVPVESVEFHELTAADLTLAVQKQELGVLETNAEQIKDAVLAALPGYTPANYTGRLDVLKKDKAALNAAATELNAKRLQLEREFLKPFEVFKGIIAETVKAIKDASGKLDEVAKAVEIEEKETKRKHIDEYWRIKEFPFPTVYAKIFDDRWLNKTAKKADIFSELDAKCDKIMADLKLLERFPGEDVDWLKAYYLDHLDISKALDEAERLKENREAVAREAAERDERERKVNLQKQAREEAGEAIAEQRAEPIRSLAAAALGDIESPEQAPPEVKDPPMTFTLEFTGPASVLRELREWMTAHGITYKKI